MLLFGVIFFLVVIFLIGCLLFGLKIMLLGFFVGFCIDIIIWALKKQPISSQ
jgi:hypothetical protein